MYENVRAMRVFVLLFNVGTDNEGIYSRRIGDRDEVLMFEMEDDATRFALQLEAQDFPSAIVEEMDEVDIREFCDSVGYEARLVTNEALEIPPEQNVEEMDWQEDGSHQADIEKRMSSNPPPTLDNKNDQQDTSELSDDEMARIRRQLEGLL